MRRRSVPKQEPFNPEALHRHVYLGAPCHIAAHGCSSQDDRSYRYQDTQACVECIKTLTRPGLVIDVNRVRQDRYHHFMRFWSCVDIRGAEDCWPWTLPSWKTKSACMLYTPWKKALKCYGPGRGAIWYSWGDIGMLPYRRLCTTKNCCNPLHLRVLQVEHHIYRRDIDHIDLVRSALKVQERRVAFFRAIQDPDHPSNRTQRYGPARWHARAVAALGLRSESQRET